MYLDMVNSSHLTGGDSGGLWLNDNNEIFATSVTAYLDNGEYVTGGLDLTYATDFILETIDGWHYPTLATANGKTEITVQSLHMNGAMDSAYTDGDATLVVEESTCLAGSIAPFETCTYVIESEGNEGTLYLSNDEVIQINATQDAEPPQETPQEGESSGGSFGLGSLLLLVGFAWRRQSKKSHQH
ncbi:possible trypsin protease [Vibrio astriarenae]|nr:possible trypsin protease [Vibrio sp. C7]